MSTPEERFNLWVIGYTSCAEAVTPWSYVDVKAAYLAATEDAARIADNEAAYWMDECGLKTEVALEIAAAIRGE